MDLLSGMRVIPDVDELISVILRQRKPKRVHIIELFLDDEVKELYGSTLILLGLEPE